MLASSTSSSSLTKVKARVLALETAQQTDTEPSLPVFGSTVPGAEDIARLWVKKFEDGSLDGIFTYVSNNWYCPMTEIVGEVRIFVTTSPIRLGWEVVTNETISLEPAEGFVFRKFTGVNCLIIDELPYRRYDQLLIPES